MATFSYSDRIGGLRLRILAAQYAETRKDVKMFEDKQYNMLLDELREMVKKYEQSAQAAPFAGICPTDYYPYREEDFPPVVKGFFQDWVNRLDEPELRTNAAL